jgi:hypothetical protein
MSNYKGEVLLGIIMIFYLILDEKDINHELQEVPHCTVYFLLGVGYLRLASFLDSKTTANRIYS